MSAPLSQRSLGHLSCALSDAALWQDSLADAQPHGSKEQRKALTMRNRYRALHKRLFRIPTAEQQVAEMQRNAPTVSIHDVKPRAPG